MGKEFIVKGWHITVMLFIFGLIISLTSYSYHRDNANKDEKITKVENKVDLKADKTYVDSKFSDHDKIHEEETKRWNQVQSDLTTIKQYLINKHDNK